MPPEIYAVWKIYHKKLHAIRFHLYNILEVTKLWKWRSGSRQHEVKDGGKEGGCDGNVCDYKKATREHPVKNVTMLVVMVYYSLAKCYPRRKWNKERIVALCMISYN